MAKESIDQKPPYLFIFLGTLFLCLCLTRSPNFISIAEWTHLMSLNSLSSGQGLDLSSAPGQVDASSLGERRIQNKPPGFIFLLIPFHTGLRWITGWVDPAYFYKPLLWVSSLCTAGIASLGFFFLLRLGLPALPALASGLGLIFCTDIVLYAPLLMRHTAVALLILIAMSSPLISLGRSRFSPLLCGLCLGLLPGFDYLAVVVAGVLSLGLGVIHQQRYGTGSLIIFLIGLGIPLMGLMFYNHQIYGSAWTTAYSSGVFDQTKEVVWTGWQGAFLSKPLAGLIPSLLSPSRGFLLLCPPLLIGLWGWIKGKNNEWTLLEKAALAAALCHLLFVSCFIYWHGGNFPGHRYLIPLVILLLPTWARVLGPLLKKPFLVRALWISALVAFAYRLFLVWIWSEPVSISLWKFGTNAQDVPLFSIKPLLEQTLALGYDPLIGSGIFEVFKLVFLVLGLIFLGLAWLQASLMQGEVVYKSLGSPS